MGAGRRASRNELSAASALRFDRGGNQVEMAEEYSASQTLKGQSECARCKPARRGGRRLRAKQGRPQEEPSEVPKSKSPRKPAAVRVTEHEVLVAMESLYVDRLKPYGRILRKRLVEQAEQSGFGVVDIDAKSLHATCSSSTALIVELEEGGEWSAVFADRPDDFVDVYSSCDSYPPEFWSAASSYFESLTADDAELPGGRYACAQALVVRQLPFLQGFSLGHVCHVVQLAITQKKLLGYSSGSTVPYGLSQSKVKEDCAALSTSNSASELPIASWESALVGLSNILDAAVAAGKEGVPISSVKNLFRTQIDEQLSETALGHAKLSELLQDTRFKDICTLELQEQGYVVVPSVLPAERRIVISLADELGPASHLIAFAENDATGDDCSDMVFCADEPLCLEDAEPLAVPKPTPSAGLSRLPAVSPATAFFEDGPGIWRPEQKLVSRATPSSAGSGWGGTCGATWRRTLALSPSTLYFEDGANLLQGITV